MDCTASGVSGVESDCNVPGIVHPSVLPNSALMAKTPAARLNEKVLLTNIVKGAVKHLKELWIK